MLRSRVWLKWGLPVILILSIGWLYLSTLAPGLSWANDGADGGDFISAVASGGVPHPTGYPTYLLLAKLFQFFPIGSIAFRTNLFSAVSATLAAVLVYYLVISLPYRFAHRNHLAGLIAAFAYGLSPLVWSQAVIAEVYSLNSLFIVAILLLLLPDTDVLPFKPVTLNQLRGLLLGLAMGNHITAVAFLPPMLLIGSFNKADRETNADALSNTFFQRWGVNWKSLITKILWLAIGLCIYLVLPLRAIADPPINWGDPVTLKNFLWLISGRLYAGRVFVVSNELMLVRIGNWVGFLVEQCGILGLAIGLAGVFFCRPLPSRIYLVSGWILIVFSIFSMGYDSYDSTVLLIPVSLMIALWVGLGISFVMQIISHRVQWLGLASGLLFMVYLAVRIPSILPKVDASQDRRAETFGEKVMTDVPENAIVFTNGDKDTFAIWYFHITLHERPDMIVLVTGLLPFDWYRDSLRSTYPALVIPPNADLEWGSAILAANPGRSMCYANSLGDTVITCR